MGEPMLGFAVQQDNHNNTRHKQRLHTYSKVYIKYVFYMNM